MGDPGERINVLLTSQVPERAEIDKVQFYFHTKWKEWGTEDISFDESTNPIVYIGGTYNAGGYDGHLSNGSYPDAAMWKDAGDRGSHDIVHGWGPFLKWSSITNKSDLPDDGYDLELVKDTSCLINNKYFREDNGKNSRYGWLIKDLFWGEPANKPADRTITYYHGFTFKSSWRQMGNSNEYSSY